MSPSPYPGGSNLLLYDIWPQLFAVALDVVPSGPVSWSDLAGHVLPYGQVNVASPADGYFYDEESMRYLTTTLAFAHPSGVGPITAVAVAVSSRTQPDWLIAVLPIETPLPTTSFGEVLSVPLTLLVLAQPSSE